MDTQELIQLIDRFEESSMAELKLRSGDFSLQMKKPEAFQAASPVFHSHPVHQAQQAYMPQPATQTTPGASAPATAVSEATEADSGTEIVTSPIVGTFYRAPSPDSPPHVEEGDTVNEGDVLCIVEAMKNMNELEAEFGMEIISILAENGAMVEFGTPLFKVRRT